MPVSFTEGKTAQDWINLVLAVLLFISPWVVGYVADTTPAWNAWIFGVVLAVITLATLSAFAEWEEWLNFIIGLWLIISPWALRFSADMNARWTHVILGILVAAVSAWAIWGHRQVPHVHA
jgi:predicted MFS family arabinose efflux permease